MNAQVNFSLETVKQSIDSANARYLSGNPTDKAGNPLTASADLRKGLKFIDETVCADFAALLTADETTHAEVLASVANKMPVKAIMRLCEFSRALSAQDYAKLDATTVLTILANVKTRDAVSFAVTGKGDESTSDEVKNIERVRRLQRLFPKVGSGTEPTQVSRSFGKNGFCRYIGLASFDLDSHGMRVLSTNKKSAIYKLVAKLVDKASDATLKTMKGTGEKAE